MFAKTNMSYGVNEVLLASVLGSVVFSIFAAQPLTIVGVTGALQPQMLIKAGYICISLYSDISGMYVRRLNNPRSNHGIQLHRI